MTYRTLDAGAGHAQFVPLEVRTGRVSGSDPHLRFHPDDGSESPTLPGVEVLQAQTFINERRTLVVTHNSQEPPGTLGYTVVVRPGCSVGDHYHYQREERIIVLHGRAEFRLLDRRRGSPTEGEANVFELDYPGTCVRIPTGVAHAILAVGTLTVLQVLASSDYDPTDDVHESLSAWS